MPVLQPGENNAQDFARTRHSTERLDYPSVNKITIEELIEERDLLKRMLKKPTSKISTAIERLTKWVWLLKSEIIKLKEE